MSYFFRNKYFFILFLVTILIFVFMGMSTVEKIKVNSVEDTIGGLLAPVQKVIYSIGDFFNSSFHFVGEMKELKQQNEELARTVDKLEQDSRIIIELKDENKRLREMLDLKQRMEQFDMVGAKIVSKEPGNWFKIFVIDKGTSDGLQKKCAVITSKGLIGHIYDIGTNWAKVITIIDSDSSVGSIVVRTRDITVVEGDLSLQREGLCKMTYISKGADIITGDLIETSGLGGIYPEGLLVGKIKEIKSEANEVSRFAIIEPSVDFERIKEVFVIKNSNSLNIDLKDRGEIR